MLIESSAIPLYESLLQISIDVVSEQKEYNRQFARGRNKPKKPKVVQTNQFHMVCMYYCTC